MRPSGWKLRGVACLLAILAAPTLAACGGGDDRAAGLSGDTAESPTRFAKNFRRLTGVSLQPVAGDLSGTRLQVAGVPDRLVRFGVYSLIWTADDDKRAKLLGEASTDDDGIRWTRTGASYTATKPFGSRLVLRWVGRSSKQVTPQFERLSRALDAAGEGSSSSLPAEERPCRAAGLDPLRGPTGECSVGGIPATFVDAGDQLSTDAVEASVLGLDTVEELRFPGLTPIVPKGRFAIVAYRLRNRSPHPIRFLHPQLRVGSELLAENPDTTFLLPRSRNLPLPAGATIEARAAFDVSASQDPRAGAFVLAAARDGREEPSGDLAQGWIRLAEAAQRLPKPPKGGDAP